MSEKQMLPRYIIFQSTQNHRYLHLNKANSNVSPLHFHGDYSYGLETRFEVVPATKEKLDNECNQLVHIRSMHNNKFWEKTRNSNTDWITATAEKTDDNPASASCTLFQAEHLGHDRASNSDIFNVILRHKNTGYYVIASYDETMYSGLKLDAQKPDVFSKFLDWQSVVMLPDRIRIKGDNGNYLRAYPQDGFLGFDPNFSNEQVFEFEVSASRDGGIRIKSVQYGRYWVDDDMSDWVFRDADFTTEHATNTVFIASEVGDNKISLRCLKNNYFCERFTAKFSGKMKENCLATRLDHSEERSRLIIEEPVFSRTIDNVIYHLTEARMYDEQVVSLDTHSHVNRDAKPVPPREWFLSSKETNKKQWTNSASLKTGVSASLTASVPKVVEGSIETSLETGISHGWGEGDEDSLEVGCAYTATMPARSGVKVSLIATKASYDVPFSYTQRDVLTNGRTKVYRKHDGLFKGHNAFNYKFVSVPLPIE
ncbi:hypothetical protein MKX03_033571 [Papaver bracteatum]|nr:hypothetical protein MKX03_033571 [Papaver bracteatum]